MNGLPPSGRWSLGNVRRDTLEALLQAARDAGLRTAWLGPEAGFVSNLSLQENLELFYDWHGRAAPFANALDTLLQTLELDHPDWLTARPAQQPDQVLQTARLLRLLLLAPDLAIVEAGDASRLMQVHTDALDRILGHSRLLLHGAASPEWPALPEHAMLTVLQLESPAS